MEKRIIETREWKISFFTPDAVPDDDGTTFGCSVKSLLANEIPSARSENKSGVWSHALRGIVLSGTFRKILNDASGLIGQGYKFDAAIILMKPSESVAPFTYAIGRILGQTICVGGVAAGSVKGLKAEPYLIPASEEAAVFLIKDKRYRFESKWLNIHDRFDSPICFRTSDGRTILSVRDEGKDIPAYTWYKKKRHDYGIDPDSFEHICFSDFENLNYHVSRCGEFALRADADLPNDGLLLPRIVKADQADIRISRFLSAENSLYFGCAGLDSLRTHPQRLPNNSIAGFFMGEVITEKRIPKFRNLMLSAMNAFPV